MHSTKGETQVSTTKGETQVSNCSSGPKRRRLRGSLLAAVAMLSVGLAACGDDDDGAQAGGDSSGSEEQSGPYKIGSVLSVTGSLAPLNAEVKMGMDFALEQVNASGLLDHPMEIEFHDAQSEEQEAVTLTNRLADGDSLALIGYTGSSLALAAKPIANRVGIPQIAIGVSDEITTPLEPYTFGITPAGRETLKSVVQWLANSDVSTVGVLYEDTAFAVPSLDGIRLGAEEFGVEIVAEEKFLPEDRDLSVPVSNVLAEDPEAIIGLVISETGAAITRAMKEQGADDVQVVWNTGPINDDYIALVGADGDGQFGVSEGLPAIVDQLPEDDPRVERYSGINDAFNEASGQNIALFSALGIDIVNVVAQAIDALETEGTEVTRETLREAIENLSSYQGVMGEYNFSAEQHRGISGVTNIVQLRDGKWGLYVSADEIREGVGTP